MSVERIQRSDGVVWRVRWRQDGRNRSKVLGRKRDAEDFDAELRRRKRTGELGELDAGKETLAEFGREWWRLYAAPNLAPATLRLYAMLWDTHILPRLGEVPIRELTPARLTEFRLQMEADDVGRTSVRKGLTLLHGVLQRACEWQRLPANPMQAVRKPPVEQARAVTPLAPDTVETIRLWMLRRGLIRDATLVSVLAYAGLRPGEALALNWAHIRERTILVEAAVAIGVIGGTKTRRRRTVRLLEPLIDDLEDWRARTSDSRPGMLVFPGHDGGPWTKTAYQNWRRRNYHPAAEAAGLEITRPYDLRHSFVSLLIAEGTSIVDVARQAGHAPTMTLTTYAHVFDEFDPADRSSAVERIKRARERQAAEAAQQRLFND